MIILIGGIIVKQTFFNTDESVEQMEYRTDSQPIRDRLPLLPEFTECYWKAETIGSSNFGPSNYWMKGFVVLENAELRQLLANYDREPSAVEFPRGIDPSVTGRTGFEWHSNTAFTEKLIYPKFVGTIYLDIENGVLYFDLENL